MSGPDNFPCHCPYPCPAYTTIAGSVTATDAVLAAADAEAGVEDRYKDGVEAGCFCWEYKAEQAVKAALGGGQTSHTYTRSLYPTTGSPYLKLCCLYNSMLAMVTIAPASIPDAASLFLVFFHL